MRLLLTPGTGFVPAVLLFASAATSQVAFSPTASDPELPEFEAPVRLLAEGAPLGKKLLYPSPRLYDIDGDGQAELVVGDLRGSVQFAERGKGDTDWGSLKPFLSGKRALKFDNW